MAVAHTKTSDEACQVIKVPKTENCNVPSKKRPRSKIVKKQALKNTKPEGDVDAIGPLDGE